MPFWWWLQGYQSFTQALGVLELKEARDAFLASLCSFALSSKMAEDADLDLPMSPASVSSPSGAPGFMCFPFNRICYERLVLVFLTRLLTTLVRLYNPVAWLKTQSPLSISLSLSVRMP